MQPIENAIEGAVDVTETAMQVAPAPTSLMWILGIALVVVLIVLIAVLAKVSKISKRLEWTDQFSAFGQIPASTPTPQFQGIDPAVVAAISATIAAFAPQGKQLVVRSVRRTSAWADAGRRESLNY